ncbi:MAG: O-antigen ligase family protein [Candidatus Moranbacteria bacterium]|nr:O-antigen ligase family protein [Candidatus Moranbacteria bacterium]
MINLEKIIKKLEELATTKTYLWVANLFLVFVLILFFNVNRLPFDNMGDFLFFSFIILAFGLYRPSWGFLVFVGAVVLENVNLAPAGIGINVRPYQLFGVLIVLAVGIKHFSNRLNFELLKMKWYDWAIIVFVASGFLSSLGSANKGLAIKQSIIIGSFALLYFLTRTFARNMKDLKKMAPFFFGSSFLVVLYAIWQNWMFQRGVSHFEVMPGRANATFSEPDWLGAFLVFVSALFLVIVFEVRKRKNLFLSACSWAFLLFTFSALILTVARSAWLGAATVVGLFLVFVLMDVESGKVTFRWKRFLDHGLFVFSALFVSVLVVNVFNLTNFELGGRATSTTSGLQEITIACDSENPSVPEVIAVVKDLDGYGCKHINLEEIEQFEEKGIFVGKVQRKDPNVGIRARIYEQSWIEIRKNPILGIGWGNISEILGRDERGAGLNSSNIFLEVWLGAGILGLVSFLVIVGNVFWRGAEALRRNEKVTGMIFILGVSAILIPNMFNAGIMLGFVWVFLGITGLEEE